MAKKNPVAAPNLRAQQITFQPSGKTFHDVFVEVQQGCALVKPDGDKVVYAGSNYEMTVGKPQVQPEDFQHVYQDEVNRQLELFDDEKAARYKAAYPLSGEIDLGLPRTTEYEEEMQQTYC